MYNPKPLDLEKIELPKELTTLIERIAENVHENWAINRIKEGWSYGEERNDILKQTPCLVPYNELPETEKEYDRKTAIETIKFIIAAGYDIKLK